MGLFDRFKTPKWQNKDVKVRLEAVKELNDQETLIEIVKNDSDVDVRKKAIEKVNDESVLVDIAKNDSEWSIRAKAVENISDESVLIDIAENDSEWVIREEAVKNISDESALINIVRNDSDEYVRLAALQKISDESVLEDVARNDSDEYVRRYAAEKIKEINSQSTTGITKSEVYEIEDETVLIDIAKNSIYKDAQALAIEKITNEPALIDIAKNHTDVEIRCMAIEKITDEKALTDILKIDESRDIQEAVVRNDNTNQEELLDIAKNHADVEIKCLAIEKITDEKALTDILRTDETHEVHEAVVSNDNTSQEALCEVANDINHDKYGFIARMNAIPKIKDDKVLSNVALNEDDAHLIYLAVCNPNLTNKKVLRQIADSNIVWHTRNDYDRDIDYNVSEVAKRKI